MENQNVNKFQPNDISQLASKYALRVALQTIKERCIAQHKRLIEVEEQNRKLRQCLAKQNKVNGVDEGDGDCDGDGDTPHQSPTIAAENVQLRLEVTELQHQNEQLHNQMDMISIENRKLWMRLSQMAKPNTKANDQDNDEDCNNIAACVMGNTRSTANINQQNLIRSKTFTQHSPNPNLRHKLLMADSIPNDDVLMANINNDETVVWTYDVVKPAAHSPTITNYDIDTNDSNSSTVAIMLTSNQTSEDDFTMEANICIDTLKDMHQQALQQQQNLNAVLNAMKQMTAVNPCLECLGKKVKPEMADKSLETEVNFNEFSQSNDSHKHETQQSSGNVPPRTHHQDQLLNVLQDNSIIHDGDKICPMCGKIYDAHISFREFCMHVEDHFQDNSSDVDESLEQAYDFVSHSVGNF